MLSVDKLVKELFNAKAHLGHKKNRVHPKAKKNIYTFDGGTSIIDLTKTAEQLLEAEKFIHQQAKEGKKMLVVATKEIASGIVKKLCKERGILYITNKWPPGLLTNFETLQKNIKKIKEMEEDKEKGEWKNFIKEEQSKLKKELNKLKRLYGGISNLEEIPDFLFLLDIKKEKNALKEAKKFNLPIVAITDTNTNPELVDYPITANDDSITSVEYLMKKILNFYRKEVKTTKKNS